MFVNPIRQIEKLKDENKRLKEKNEELLQQIEQLKKIAEEHKQIASTEINRAQKILLDCERIEKQWRDAIEAARLSKNKYDDLYKKCYKLKHNYKK